jgi:hypothetical protein
LHDENGSPLALCSPLARNMPGMTAASASISGDRAPLRVPDFLPEDRADACPAFQPRAFFMSPWTGSGIVQNLLGTTLGTYRVEGGGSRRDGRVVLEHAFEFDNGFSHRAEWEIDGTGLHTFEAHDRLSGVRARGFRQGDAFRWIFRTRAPTPFGVQTIRSDALYSMLGPNTATSVTRCFIFGVKMCTMTTYYAHI